MAFCPRCGAGLEVVTDIKTMFYTLGDAEALEKMRRTVRLVAVPRTHGVVMRYECARCGQAFWVVPIMFGGEEEG